MRLISLFLASAVTLLLTAPAFAGSERHSAKVRHADLNLADADGQRTLDRRVVTTAKRVCAIDDTERQLTIMMHERRCLRDAVADARPAVLRAVSRASGTQVNVVAAGGQQ